MLTLRRPTGEMALPASMAGPDLVLSDPAGSRPSEVVSPLGTQTLKSAPKMCSRSNPMLPRANIHEPNQKA